MFRSVAPVLIALLAVGLPACQPDPSATGTNESPTTDSTSTAADASDPSDVSESTTDPDDVVMNVRKEMREEIDAMKESATTRFNEQLASSKQQLVDTLESKLEKTREEMRSVIRERRDSLTDSQQQQLRDRLDEQFEDIRRWWMSRIDDSIERMRTEYRDASAKIAEGGEEMWQTLQEQTKEMATVTGEALDAWARSTRGKIAEWAGSADETISQALDDFRSSWKEFTDTARGELSSKLDDLARWVRGDSSSGSN